MITAKKCQFLFAGVGAYNYFLKEVPLRKMFLWTAVVGTALGSTQLILISGKHLTTPDMSKIGPAFL